MNGEYLRKIDPAALGGVFFKWAEDTGNLEKIKNWDKNLAGKVIEMEHENFKLLKEVPGLIDFFFNDSVEYTAEALGKTLKADTAKMVLEESAAQFEKPAGFFIYCP